MEFRKGPLRKFVFLEDGDMMSLTDSARWEWSHGINSRMTDLVNNKVVKRERRVSLTYRVAVTKEKEVMPFRSYVAKVEDKVKTPVVELEGVKEVRHEERSDELGTKGTEIDCADRIES